MAPRKGSRWPFARPGRATVCGVLGTLAAAAASASLHTAAIVAAIAAIVGCYDPAK